MASWTDNFNRAAIGANWTGSVGGDLAIDGSVRVTGVSGSADNSMYWNANTPTDAQYVQAALSAAAASTFQGPILRGSATDWVLLDADRSSNAFRIEWYNSGSWTAIGSDYSATPAANDVLKLTASGTDFEGFVNGTSRITGSNGSAPSAGRTGLYVYDNVATNASLDDFEGGDLAGGPDPEFITEAGAIASTAAVGGPVVSYVLSPGGIASGAAVGSPGVIPVLSPSGIASGAGVGSPGVSYVVTPTGIAPTGGVGAPGVSYVVTPTGIPSTVVFGTPTVTPYFLWPGGIAPTSSVGTPVVSIAGAGTTWWRQGRRRRWDEDDEEWLLLQ